jgi:hypothetical protein
VDYINNISFVFRISCLFSTLILGVWVVTIAGSVAILDALIVTAFFAIFILPAVIIVFLLLNKERKTPTGYKMSWSELSDDA